MNNSKKSELYVWELPVRLYHLVNALCVTILFITGLYIGNPVSFRIASEATYQHVFSWIRYIHFATAYIFVINFIVRIYWAYNGGNKWASFHRFKPWRVRFWKNRFSDQLKAYLFMTRKEPHYRGHNPVAALAHFLFIFCGTVFMSLSGLALLGQNNPGGFLDTMFGWMTTVFGSMLALQSMHHLVAWAFVVYLILHVYAVVRHDLVDRTAITSSIISGFKWEAEEVPE